tara:strand:+ start:10473 stop:11375 length:903 start_codon:yes stop_codon:yes gene_type:complete
MTSFEEFKSIIGDNKFGVSIGNFDGVHLGHQNLLGEFLAECGKKSLASVVYTFTPHPALYFDPAKNHLITSYKKKVALIKELGVDYVVELEFNKDLQNMTAKEFSQSNLLCFKSLKLLWVGHDFTFGKDKKDPKWIEELKQDVQFKRHSAFQVNHETVSSSLIRNYLMEGSIALANTLLGREFSIVGEVVKGKQLGRELGFPTLNIMPEYPFLIPALGVYKVRCKIDSEIYLGLMNLGRNPSVDSDGKIKIEVHLLDFARDVYGEEVEVIVDDYIREERKFDNIEELKLQIKRDKKVYGN